MKFKQKKPDTARALQNLKDFQKKTVKYVFQRLYKDKDSVDRFLIADEVGLGKTLVARGIIAKAVEEIWDTTKRIDIVYICANRDIASQNINRLNITAERGMAHATRMTLLPLKLHSLKGNKLNFVSFTPGTSFDLHSREGLAYERALIYHILKKAWGFSESAGPKNLFQCGMTKVNWRNMIERFDPSQIDRSLANQYILALRKTNIRYLYNRVVKRFGHYRKHIPQQDKDDQRYLIGELRTILAKSCVCQGPLLFPSTGSILFPTCTGV